MTLAASIFVCAPDARAQDKADDKSPPYVIVRSETHFQLYRRALLPGAYGAIVDEQLAAPITESASLNATELDAPWQKQSLDVQLDVWGAATFGAAGEDRRFDGDVRSMSIRYRAKNAWARVGRQAFTGGAARYSRFDGAAVGGQLPFGLGLEGYGGLTVLPRWNGRMGYHQLGSASDTLLRDPSAVPEPVRSGYWLAGGRLFYDSSFFDAGISIHEQREQKELGRRTLGADARWDASSALTFGTNGMYELDARRVSEARAFADFTPNDRYALDLEVSHAEPALFLSRQSVLSVFSTDGYQEGGLSVSYRPIAPLTLIGSGYGELYSGGDKGGRGDFTAKIRPDRQNRTLVIASYGRVRALGNGYHSLRASARHRPIRPLIGSVDSYFYFYDQAIRDKGFSTVVGGTLEWLFSPVLRAMWGASIARSPYAAADAQTQLRLVYGPSNEDWR
jgi:hypothetical protein